MFGKSFPKDRRYGTDAIQGQILQPGQRSRKHGRDHRPETLRPTTGDSVSGVGLSTEKILWYPETGLTFDKNLCQYAR